MVVNGSVVVAVANLSANLCQYIACNPERLNSDQVLYLIFCLPCTHIGRLADSLCLCFNPPDHHPLSDDDEEDADEENTSRPD